MSFTDRAAALICIDFINEYLSPEGKLSSDGYIHFLERNHTIPKTAKLQQIFRDNFDHLIHVKTQFSENYIELPSQSPLLGHAKHLTLFKANTWGTDFHQDVTPHNSETIVTKNRLSAFASTNLDLMLKAKNIQDIYIIGVATDLAVESTVRNAHDLDYRVFVISSCCAAAKQAHHERSIESMQAFAKVMTFEEFRRA